MYGVDAEKKVPCKQNTQCQDKNGQNWYLFLDQKRSKNTFGAAHNCMTHERFFRDQDDFNSKIS